MSYDSKSLELHKKMQWKLEMVSKIPVTNAEELSVAYTPGVAAPCLAIAEDSEKVYELTMKWNTIAIVSDGSAVLWLGNIWPEASLPVMEGKAVLFKEFANVNTVPIVLWTQETEEIIQTIVNIVPGFWWINLEDISAPRCFEIERRLNELLDIPVFHDDQHGTAIVVLAGIMNALKVTGKKKEDIEVVVNGVGAAGVATTKLLLERWIKDILLVDSKWIIYEWRDYLNAIKQELAKVTNKDNISGDLATAVTGRDIFIGVSKPWLLTSEMVKTMKADSIIFAMANPIPEIMPDEARTWWARIIATWRSDFPNQINNVLVFPGIFKWALKARVTDITNDMKLAAANRLASLVEDPSEDMIIPSPFAPWVADAIAQSVIDFAHQK